MSLLVGTQSNGMGHETAYAQIAADLLGLPIEAFRYVQADTREGARRQRPWRRAVHAHGRCGAVQGGRCDAGEGPRDRRSAAAGVDGTGGVRRWTFRGAGRADRAIDLLGLARAARDPANLPDDMSPGLDTYVWNLLDLITFPNGCHIAEVEIDPETGAVTLERYTAVDDFGTLINPMLTIGQVQGGVAQGIGQAMFEHTVYDPDSGQMLSGSFMDYALPHAEDLPDFDITLSGVPTNANPLGVKGSGQAGAMASPQAIIAAVLDALAPLGVTHIDMPATSERVWQAIQGAATHMIGRRHFSIGGAALALAGLHGGANAQGGKSVLRVVPQAEPQVFDPHQSRRERDAGACRADLRHAVQLGRRHGAASADGGYVEQVGRRAALQLHAAPGPEVP